MYRNSNVLLRKSRKVWIVCYNSGLSVYRYIDSIYVSYSYCAQGLEAPMGRAYSHVSYMSSLTQLSPPLHPDYCSTSLLRHNSLLAEGHRKQHKQSIQLHAPQKIWQDIKNYAMIKSPFILGPSTVLSPLRVEAVISPHLCVCVKRKPAAPLKWSVLLQFLCTMPSPSDDN